LSFSEHAKAPRPRLAACRACGTHRRWYDRLRIRRDREEMAGVRMFETLQETFWVLALAVIALFAFFAALGAFSPLDVIWMTIVVGVLCVLWILHGVLEGRHRDRRDPAAVRARERRGF
jgi:hypothetical protein